METPFGVYNTTESFTDSVSLILGRSPVGRYIFISTLHMGKLRHSECRHEPWSASGLTAQLVPNARIFA